MSLTHHPVDDNGDVHVIVGRYKIKISSTKMYTLSSKFEELLCAGDEVSLSEDPDTFLRICQSAHGIFVPQADISTYGLVKLVEIIERYQIKATAQIYGLAEFCWIVQTLEPAKLSTKQITHLLQVAKVLSVAKLRQFLRDIFLHYRIDTGYFFQEEEKEEEEGLHLLLASAVNCIKFTHNKVACSLLKYYEAASYQHDSNAEYAQNMFAIGIWILEEYPSLHIIRKKLNSVPCRHYDAGIDRGIWDALGIIAQAEEDFSTSIEWATGNSEKD